MISPIRIAKTVFHGKVSANSLARSIGFSKFARVDDGLYRFEGEFEPSKLIVQAQVADPWAKEMTAVKVGFCAVHMIENYSCCCPDEGDECRLIESVVLSPRWQPVVSGISRDRFYVNIWHAPLAPEDGTAAVGDSVRADVDFFIAGMEV